MALMKLVLNITGAQPTAFMVRLPSAVWGILSVLAIYGCGRVLAENAFALFLAALFALNPFHIGISREAYFYPPLVCGSALMLWAIFLQIRSGRDKTALPVSFYVLLASGFFLTTYAQPSSWSFALIAALAIVALQVKGGFRNRAMLKGLFWIFVILTIIGTPLLFADWSLSEMFSISSPAHKEYVNRVIGSHRESIWSLLQKTALAFSWGTTWPRAMFTVAVLLSALATMIYLWQHAFIIKIFVILTAGGIVLFVITRFFLAAEVSSRYLLAFLPLHLIWLALGLWLVPGILRASGKIGKKVYIAVLCGLMAVALGLNLWPAYLATRLTGKPIPYWDIARWCDKNLPPHTLVLVERWLDPWNELRVHNSTNVYFTFPVPSEPQDVFERMNWPAAARQFMEKYPDAAYLEFSRLERPVKAIATNWPFARSVSFTNEAAIRLARLGLAHREEFFTPDNNRLINTIFYNTREDVLANARNAGKQYLVLYGPEWGYVKLWQQLRDFRDWRVLENRASLEIYNLTSSTNRVTLKLRGMALNGSKRVASDSQYHDFRHLQMEEWELKDIALRPGLNQIVFSDPLWSISKIPLLTSDAQITPARQNLPKEKTDTLRKSSGAVYPQISDQRPGNFNRAKNEQPFAF
ncbi:MAG: hypothetical protein PHP98_00990 [Kiritimatiellae bacterium]|nr:hypothetical protein [Kiritimatiellia bacterium]